MNVINDETPSTTCLKTISKHCREYQGADAQRSIFQLVITLSLYVCLLIVMFFSMSISYWITLALTIPAAGLLTRIFIFQHDCGHGSFFNSSKANNWTGRFLSLLTAVPYDVWRRSHNMHHATSGNLDHRNVGGIDTITVKEYLSYSPLKRFCYRLYRNPFLSLMIGTPLYILVIMRIPHEEKSLFYPDGKSFSVGNSWKGTILTTLAFFMFYGLGAYLFGWLAILGIILPILILTSWIGGWLFYIQHQFEETYWDKNEDWNLSEASLHGSSYYELPKVIQWFTGNIGLHHIHHLCSKIPNYKLQECMDAKPELREINRITFLESLKCVHFKLWDEEKRCLVNFNQI